MTAPHAVLKKFHPLGKPKSPGLAAVEIRDLSKHFGPATTVRAQDPVRLTGALERRGHRVDRDGDVLNVLGATPQEVGEIAGDEQLALQYLADAFTIGGLHSAGVDSENDRAKMGELYRKLHGSETGLGDLVLKAYDSTSSQLAARRAELRELDPNSELKNPIQFTLTGLEGDKLPLSSLLGKVVVLDFWATWCAPCREQHPLYEQVKAKFKDSGDVVFLAVDTDEDHTLVKPLLNQIKWNQKVYFEDGLQSLLQDSSIPTTVILGKNGEVFTRMVGYLPDRFVDMLTERVNDALGKEHAQPQLKSSHQ